MKSTETYSVGFLLQGVPELIGPPEQGHIVGVLVVLQADDPGQAVRRALVVCHSELLDAQHLAMRRMLSSMPHQAPWQVGSSWCLMLNPRLT